MNCDLSGDKYRIGSNQSNLLNIRHVTTVNTQAKEAALMEDRRAAREKLCALIALSFDGNELFQGILINSMTMARSRKS